MNPWNSPLFGWLFLPPACLYGLFIQARNWLYKSRVLPSGRSKPCVISVGNLTVGGTGKTPMVLFLADRLQKKGYRVAVISRGYGRSTKGARVVSDGTLLHETARESGDEPFLMASKLSGIPVVVSRRRMEGVSLIERIREMDILILDDAFQHLKVRRDLDIVMIDAIHPWGNGRLLPAGPCREPLSSLGRAGAVVLSHGRFARDRDFLIGRISRYTQAPVWGAEHRPVHWVNIHTGQKAGLKKLRGKRIMAFAGIGNFKAFLSTLGSLDLDIQEWTRFRDHHRYSPQELDRLAKEAAGKGIFALVTTEKDAVRIPEGWRSPLPVYRLVIELHLGGDIRKWDEMIAEAVHSKRSQGA